MKKRLIVLAAVALLLFGFTAQAAVTAYATPTLTFTGNTANCGVIIRDKGKYIDATLELWQGNSMVASWSNTGYSLVNITGTYVCTSGITYTLRVSGTAGGVTISYTPVSGSC